MSELTEKQRLILAILAGAETPMGAARLDQLMRESQEKYGGPATAADAIIDGQFPIDTVN